METITLEEFNNRINGLINDLNNAEPILNEVGLSVTNTIRDSFEAQSSPFGQKWKPLSNATLRAKRGSKMLVQSGLLKISFLYKATNKSVEVGTNKEYAPIHQFGGKAGRNKRVNIPARPFMPINSSGEIPANLKEEVEQILLDAVEKRIMK